MFYYFMGLMIRLFEDQKTVLGKIMEDAPVNMRHNRRALVAALLSRDDGLRRTP